jgi:hypothetical protein
VIATCAAHPLGSDSGATCTLAANHGTEHIFVSAWLADRHDRAEAAL